MLSLPIEAKTQRALQAYLERGSMAPRAGGRRSSQAESEETGVEIWTALQVISLNFMATGCSNQPPRLCRKGASAAQARALARLRSRAEAFCGNDRPGEEAPRGASCPWTDRYKDRRLSYTGEALTAPLPLTAAQLEPGLPPDGAGGSIPILDFLDGDLAWVLEDPTRCLLPAEQRPDVLPITRVHVEDDAEWENIVRLLLALGIVPAVADAEISRHRGRRVLNGAFPVEKPGKFLDNGRVVRRLIMDVWQTNALLLCLQGDLPSMAFPSQFLSLIVGADETLLWSGEDLVASFYLFGLPRAWAAWFCFEREVEGARVGLPTGRLRVCASVLPMGFSGATGCLQSLHRRVAIEPADEVFPGLDPEREFRRDTPRPHLSDQGPMLSIYFDDLTDVEPMKLVEAMALIGTESDNQTVIR